jgi:hypothetical protein
MTKVRIKRNGAWLDALVDKTRRPVETSGRVYWWVEKHGFFSTKEIVWVKENPTEDVNPEWGPVCP